MDFALIAWRAVHFLATVQIGGLVIFCAVVLRSLQSPADVRRRLDIVFWLSFVALLVSGACWEVSVARAIDGTTSLIAFSDGTALSVLTDTQFGTAWLTRSGAAFALAIASTMPKGHVRTAVQLICAAFLVAGLAFAGHGASSPGVSGDVHLAADIFHLIAVTAWLGGLLPYAIVLRSLIRGSTQDGVEEARMITLRYSGVATVAVLTIFATGIVNSLFLVGSIGALVTSDYGRLLTLKILVFAAMLVLAAINRFVLMKRFTPENISSLNQNALIEFSLGIVALLIVAAFGTMPPPLLDSGTAPAL